MPGVGFEPTIPVLERPKIGHWDRQELYVYYFVQWYSAELGAGWSEVRVVNDPQPSHYTDWATKDGSEFLIF
jgi:hypothetical protein